MGIFAEHVGVGRIGKFTEPDQERSRVILMKNASDIGGILDRELKGLGEATRVSDHLDQLVAWSDPQISFVPHRGCEKLRKIRIQKVNCPPRGRHQLTTKS